MDITKLTVVELKALAYDVFAGIENGQRNLKAINEEIIKKSTSQTPTETPVETIQTDKSTDADQS